MHLCEGQANRIACGDSGCNVHCEARGGVHVHHRLEFGKVFFKSHHVPAYGRLSSRFRTQ